MMLISAMSCGDHLGDRFEGDYDPCEVKRRPGPLDIAQTYDPAGLSAAKQGYYWRSGPYPIWATSPDPDRCENNPHAPPAYGAGAMPLYITYPAQQWPARTGIASIARGKWPVVVFAHANHDRTCRIFDRYVSLHDHWASWGAIVISISSTLHNCQPGSYHNLLWRKQDIERTLETLKTWNSQPDHWLYDRLDLDRVILAGHSRGGGAALLASMAPPQGVNIRGVINLQGIDLTSFGFGSPQIKTPTLGIVAGNDVDVNFPGVDGNQELIRAPHTWVTLFGAIHAYTADTSPLEFDDEPKITRQQQRDMTQLYTTAFMAHHLGIAHEAQGPPFALKAQDDLLYGYGGVQLILDHITRVGAAARWDARRPQTLSIDDFNRAELGTTNLLGLPTQATGFPSAKAPRITTAYDPDDPAAKQDAVKFKAKALWLRGQGRWQTTLNLEASPQARRLVARVKAHGAKPARFALTIQTPSGLEHILGASIIGPMPITDRYTQLIAPLPAAQPITAIGVELLHADDELIIDDLRVELP